MADPPPSAWMRRIILLIFALSGASALIYQLVWMRRLTLVFGSTTLAVSTVLAAFMGGLALGSLLFGRYTDRRPERALPVYGLVEIALGLLALLLPVLFRLAETVYLSLYPGLEGAPQIFFVVQFLVTALVIVPPTTLMGGTLPLLSRAVVGRLDDMSGRVGSLYAANTFGASGGMALATYALLPTLGLTSSQVLAALLNLAAGGTALLLDGILRRHGGAGAAAVARGGGKGRGEAREAREARERRRGESPGIPAAARVLLLGTALSGFAAMLLEVTWSRILALVLGSSVYAFGSMVLLFLLGISAGSALFARMRVDPARAPTVFALAQSGIAVAVLVGMVFIPRMPVLLLRLFPVVQHSFPAAHLVQLLLTGVVVLPAALGFGVAFPAVATGVTGSLSAVGRGVGSAAALNTLGTVAGALLAGFLFIPQLGLRATLLLAAAAVTVAAAGARTIAVPARSWRQRAPAALAALPVLLALILPAWPRPVLASGAGFYASIYKSADELLAAAERTEILYYRDGISSTLSVDRSAGYRFYRVNGKTDASTHPGDMANQLLLGHLPMLLHPAPAEVFVLGLGTGVTAAAVARHPVRRIDIVDIEPAAREAARFFEEENHRVLADPRVRLITADGRNALLARPREYDVIISDPSDVWTAGVGTLFTEEFYLAARARLRPGGLMVQWFHTHVLPPEHMKLIVATFRSVFPHASLWRSNRGDMILLGSVQRVAWDYPQLRQRFHGVVGVEEELRSAGLWHPLSVFAAFVLDDEALMRLTADIREEHRDDRPVIEFLAPRALYTDTTTLNDMGIQRLQVRLYPPLRGFVPARDQDARATYLLGFGYASLGRTDLAIDLMEQSVRREPGNAKYLVGLANQYRAKGLADRAAAAYRRALARDPAESEAAIALAALLREGGEKRQADEVLRAALAAAPGDAALLAAAADLWLDLGEARNALPAAERALQGDPRNGPARLLYGRILRAAGRRDDAIAELRQAAVLLPEDGPVHRELGSALLDAGLLKDAAEAFERAVAIDRRDVDAWVGLAQAAARRGDLNTARRARGAAVRLDPYRPSVLDLFGR